MVYRVQNDPPSRPLYVTGSSHQHVSWFRCNGASNPIELSPDLSSVVRVDDGADGWYRLTFDVHGAFDKYFCNFVEVNNLITTQLLATRLTGATPTNPAGLVAPDGRSEFDVGIWNSGSALYTNSHSDAHYVSIFWWLDLSEATSSK